MDSKFALFELAVAVLETDPMSFNRIVEAAVQYNTVQAVGQLSDAPVIQETKEGFFKRVVEGIILYLILVLLFTDYLFSVTRLVFTIQPLS